MLELIHDWLYNINVRCFYIDVSVVKYRLQRQKKYYYNFIKNLKIDGNSKVSFLASVDNIAHNNSRD